MMRKDLCRQWDRKAEMYEIEEYSRKAQGVGRNKLYIAMNIK